jgi:transposase
MWALGIDVSKDELVVSLQQAHPGEQPQVMAPVMAPVPPVANSASGHAKLVRWLHKQLASQDVVLADIHADIHVVMEATNVYWEACAHHFHALGCTARPGLQRECRQPRADQVLCQEHAAKRED